jgi:Antibiotic biosynthesis monooxygenase
MMSQPVVETARIALAPGRTEADLIAASATFQSFLDGQPGFLSRELLKAADGSYLDLVHWQDHAAAEAMMQDAMTSPACQAYFAVMDMSAADPTAGVAHFDMLARYGRA